MKNYPMYVCETCNKESPNKEEIELCEGRHLGLTTLEDKRTYDALLHNAKHASYVVSVSNNPENRKAEDIAIERLLEFEKEHNIKAA